VVLMLLLVLIAFGGYLNHFGLPDFIKRPLLENLRSRGVDLEFSRLRLRWYRGIVAEDVRFLGTHTNAILPEFTARGAEVRLNYAALARLKLDVTGIEVHDGTLVWHLDAPVAAPMPGSPPSALDAGDLAITNLTARLRFLPGDEWSLEYLEARFCGAQFHVNAQITNATALRQLPVFQGRTRTPPGELLKRLRGLRDQLARIQFAQPPEFRLTVTGDGADASSFAGVFNINAPDATTPWGELLDARLQTRLHAATTNAPPTAGITLTANRARTAWAALRNLDLQLTAAQTGSNELRCALTVGAEGLETEWAAARGAQASLSWLQGFDDIAPQQGDLQLRLAAPTSRWARAEALVVHARFAPALTNFPADAALGWWAKALPYTLALDCAATNLVGQDVQLDSAGLTARWAAPRLELVRLEARSGEGRFASSADLDVLSRQLGFDAKACFDLRLLDRVLTDKSREWMDHFTWQLPPALNLAGHLTLPVWTNRQPDWRGEVQPGIVLRGSVGLTNSSYRGISALTAFTHLAYSNRVWRLPDLTLVRPEGTLHVDLQSDEVSHDYDIKLRGPLDPRALESQLDEKGRRGLGYFEFTSAPWLDIEVCGRWFERERTWARGGIAWTNFSFRAQHADSLTASLEYSNQVLEVYRPRIERGGERVTADGIRFDFAANRAYLTNGFTDTDPLAIATAIGPKVAAAVTNYHFLQPPLARVSGVIPLRGEKDADLHFDLEGGPFHWMKFKLPHLVGHVWWANESVTLSNITASFYGGEARGNAWFDVRTPASTPFRFELATTNADLHALMSDLHSPTNRLEGTLAGRLVVTEANTADWQSWNGYGQAALRDGLIWDTPVFGIMSEAMNTIIPGIGNSRASEAAGTFRITNSVIHTRDLDIRASGMRLQYEGTVDFRTRVDARVQAELLRDTPVLGRIFSTALWPVSKLFEYKVTGTLAQPKPEPVYLIPKIFLAPLHPLKAIKGVFQTTPVETNAPPVLMQKTEP
jgi:hypothetical protein